MDSTVTRLARLRADIASGSYAPPVDAVAEALVGWIARPEQFEQRVAMPMTTGTPNRTVGSRESEVTMEIVVQGRNVTVDPAIDADSRRKLGKLGRLASDIRRIEVEFSEVRNPRVADAQQCEVRCTSRATW